MRSRSDARGWEFGPSAATLVLAYLLVLQGVFAGAMSLRAANAFGAAICLSKASGPLNDNPVAPRAPMRHGEKCCVFHSAAGGSPPALHPFAGEPPRALNFVAIKRAYHTAQPPSGAATPPLGPRAPPILV